MQKVRKNNTMLLVLRPRESLGSIAYVYPGQIFLNCRTRTRTIFVLTSSLSLELCFQGRKVCYRVDDAVYVATTRIVSPIAVGTMSEFLCICYYKNFIVHYVSIPYRMLRKVHVKQRSY